MAGLVDLLMPGTGEDQSEDDLALLRRTAVNCLSEAESLQELSELIRYRIAQPEVPLETPYARVMSFHKSKGLTADLVVLAGLVDGLVPRTKDGSNAEQRRLQTEEQRRLFFVGMTRTTGRVPRRVEKGSGVIFRLLTTSRPEGRRTGGLRRGRTYQGRRVA
jgi:superfamily I DNA/RNA helicase